MDMADDMIRCLLRYLRAVAISLMMLLDLLRFFARFLNTAIQTIITWNDIFLFVFAQCLPGFHLSNPQW
jgi:hypothetical protein